MIERKQILVDGNINLVSTNRWKFLANFDPIVEKKVLNLLAISLFSVKISF